METTADGNAAYGDTTLAWALAQRCWETIGDYLALIKNHDRFCFSPRFPNGGEDEGTTYSPHSLLDTIGAFHMAGAVGPHGFDAATAIDVLQKEFGSFVNPLANGRCMDIPPVGMDKGVAVARYAEKMGIAADGIWTAGDNYNDIAMLAPFHGCAMENGVQAAKDAAEYVCRDLSEVIAQIRKTAAQ